MFRRPPPGAADCLKYCRRWGLDDDDVVAARDWVVHVLANPSQCGFW